MHYGTNSSRQRHDLVLEAQPMIKHGSLDGQTRKRCYCLALVTEAFGGKGGIAQFNRDFLRAIDQTGLMIEVNILPRLGEAQTVPRYESLVQKKALFSKYAYTVRALWCALTKNPDLVLSGHLYHGPLAHFIARLTRARLVSVLHGTEVWKPVSAQHLKPLKHSDIIICVSEDTKQRILEHLPAENHSRIFVLHNTVEERFSSGDRCIARAQFGLGNDPVVLTVGRLDDRGGYKGHDRIIPIIATLRRSGHEICYLIAGTGPDKPRLQALAREAGVEDLVRFLGYVSDEDLPALYRAADVFAMPSVGEGFGIVFLEAMACGTPAIGLRIGGAIEALQDLGTAVDAEQFEESLIALLNAPRPEGLSNAVHKRFGERVFKQQVDQLIEKVSDRV